MQKGNDIMLEKLITELNQLDLKSLSLEEKQKLKKVLEAQLLFLNIEIDNELDGE